MLWGFHRSVGRPEAVAAATYFLQASGYRVVAGDEPDTADAIPVRFEEAVRPGIRWYVRFRRALPPGLTVSRPEVEVWVHSETGVAEWPFPGDYWRPRRPEDVPMDRPGWAAGADPVPMLEWVVGRATDRKLRLLACGWCRQYPVFPRDEPLRRAVDAMERLADGRLSESDRPRYDTEAHHALASGVGAASGSAAAFGTLNRLADGPPGYEVPPAELCGLIRCVFGNPFRPVALDPGWLTSTVLPLATGVYQDRAFDRLPILADALQDAGCDDRDVLDHCRNDGPHVRGCWVVDLLLGKE